MTYYLLPKNSMSPYANEIFGETWEMARLEINSYFQIVSKGLISNQFSLKIAKTVCIAFGLYADSVPIILNIHINDKPIQKSEVCKYLDILMDRSLIWNAH